MRENLTYGSTRGWWKPSSAGRHRSTLRYGKGGCQQSVENRDYGCGIISDSEGGGSPEGQWRSHWNAKGIGFDKNFLKIFK